MKASTLVEFAPRLFTDGPSRAWSSPIHSRLYRRRGALVFDVHGARDVIVNRLEHGGQRAGNVDEGKQEVDARDLRARHVPGRAFPVGGVAAHARLPPLDVALREVPARSVLAPQARIEVLLLAAECEQVVVTLPDGIGWRGKSLAKRGLAPPLASSEAPGAAGHAGCVGGSRWSVHRSNRSQVMRCQ